MRAGDDARETLQRMHDYPPLHLTSDQRDACLVGAKAIDAEKRMAEGIMQCVDAGWRPNDAKDWSRPELILAEYVNSLQRQVEGALTANNVLQTLTERAQWYRDGCPFLEDREGYFASGDCARDAASDLEAALSEIRVLERVLVLARMHR